MKKGAVKQFFIGIFVLAVLGGGVYLVYNITQNKKENDFAMRIAEFGPRKGVPSSIEELQRAISVYEKAQEQFVKAAAQTGTYWKILASRFSDKEMFLEAVNALSHAIEYTPNDEVLHYLTGINAAQTAKSIYDYTGKGGIGENSMRYFNIAEAAYKRAVELEPEYSQARYGLAILYIYELNRPEDGIEQLLRYFESRSGDSDAMMVMARACYMTDQFKEAVNWYNRAIPLTKDKAKKAEAEANRKYILGLL